MIEWFCSGKIYERVESGGHICTGFFSSTAISEDNVPLKEVHDRFTESVSNEYGVSKGYVHIENLYKA